MLITWPEAQINSDIHAIRNAIGRLITINVTTSGIGCSNCSLDPITNTSTDSICPVCFGQYWLNTVSGFSVSGHVRWYSAETPQLLQGGKLPDGDCKVTIAYTAENLNAVENAADFLVDGKRTTLKYYRIKGAKQPNRISITLLEEGKDNG
jgi:hypothetical protein